MNLPRTHYRFLQIAALFFSAMLVAACDRGPDRSTPEGTIEAARWAVERGEAKKLGSFIYSDSPDMKRLMRRFGVFLGNVQDLGNAIQAKFPKEVEQMRSVAETAAKEGKATSLLGLVSSQMRGGRNRRSGPPNTDVRGAFDEALKNLFADPYAWIRESETRLTTTFLTDDSVALLWDGQPIMPPIGMVLKRDAADGLWYFLLPTNLPGVSSFMPKTKEQFEIFGGLIKVFDQVIIDLKGDVESGRLSSLDQVASKAGEKTFIPAAMTVFAYTKLTENQKKVPAEAPK
jgi:hypothetical protein